METNDFKQTLSVDINIPEHEKRKSSSLFERTRKTLIEREQCCYICGRTGPELEHPLEAHHHPIEWSMTNMIDWDEFSKDCKAGKWGIHAQQFDWETFFAGAMEVLVNGAEIRIPQDPYQFVDDMRANGMLLCKEHHIGRDEGIHTMPHPLWIAQKYGIEGYQFNSDEILHHEERVS